MFGGAMILRSALPYLVAIALVFGALFGSYRFGVHVEHLARVAEVADLNGQHQEEMMVLDRAHTTALATEQQRRLDDEAKHAADMAALDMKYTKEIQYAKTRSDADIAAVRSGAWRVRDKYTCAGTGTGGTSGAADKAGTSTSMGDAATQRGLGAEDAAVAIGAADEGDGWAKQLMACQDIVRRDRQGHR